MHSSRALFFLLLFVSGEVFCQTSPAADCVINPSRITDLSSPVAGVLESVLVEKSDQIVKGQVVAQLEASVEKATVRLSKVRAEIDSEIQESEVTAAFDGRRKHRFDALFKQNTVSEDVKDDVDRDEKLSTVRLQQAKELKKIRELELYRAQAQLHQKTIKAPFDGFVLQRFKLPGEYVEEQPIMRVAQLNPLTVDAVLPIEMYGKIQVGMSGDVRIESMNNENHSAKVTVVDRAGNAASGTFGITLELPNPDYKLPAGLKCNVIFDAQIM